MSEDLPTPPLRLRRIYLSGVGPEGARFDPLDVDFATDDGAASRVLLSLTNTGGKSTLITLVTSLIVPASRAQMGGKQLGDYVLSGDTAHVVCEWEDDATDVRTITGTVMEWKDGRKQPGYNQRSTTNMHRSWYLFRTRPDFPGIDDLPFLNADGRRTPFPVFVKSVRELLTPYPAAQTVIVDKQHEWLEALEKQTSIDPVLVGYQMRMNDSEAGAEKLLESFDSPDNVVRFFIAAFNDERQLADYTSKLQEYADLAGKRPRLEALNKFCQQAGPRVDQVATCAQVVHEAELAEARARDDSGKHAAALVNRVKKDRQELADLAVQKQQAYEKVNVLRKEYNQVSDIRGQLDWEAAHAKVAAAEAAEEECQKAEEERKFESRAWDAVRLVLDIAGARARVDTCQKAYDEVERGMAPLRRRADQAASAYAARLDALAAEAQRNAEEATNRADEAGNERQRAQERVAEANRRADDARRRIEALDETTRAADEAVEQAVSDGWIADGEPVRDCVARWVEKRDAARVEEDEANPTAAQEQTESDRAVDAVEELDAELVGLRERRQTHRTRLEAFDREMAELAEDDVLLTLLNAAPEDIASVERTADLASRTARESDERAAGHEQLADEAQREVAHLDATGTAPAGPDTLAVLKVLSQARIGAVTGLQWIEKNVPDPDTRSGYIAAHPDFAGGVVVSDPKRFGEVTALLTDHALRTRTTVTVTVPTGEHTANAEDPEEPSYVVVPHRATWDQEWAAWTRDEFEQSAARESQQAALARDAARRHRACSASCGSFAARWKGTSRGDLQASADEAASAVGEREEQRVERQRDRRRHRERADAARDTRENAQRKAHDARQWLAKVEALRDQVDKAEHARAEKPDRERDLTQAQGDVDDSERVVKESQRIRDVYTQEAAEQRSNREQLLNQRARIGAESAAEDPGGSLEEVRTAWETVCKHRDDAERGMSEAAELDHAKEELDRLEVRREQHGEQELERAEALAATPAASSDTLLNSAVNRAQDAASQAESERLRTRHDAEQARAELNRQRPTGRQNYADLSRTPEWQPATPEDIPELKIRLEAHGVDVRNRRDEAENDAEEFERLHSDIAKDIESLNDTVTMWSAEHSSTEHVFRGTKESARDRMVELIQAHGVKGEALSKARYALREAVQDARAVATRWNDLDERAAVRLRELSEAHLVTEAEVLAKRIRDQGASAAGDLEDLNTHRDILRDGLGNLCRDQRRLLREITRESRLPPGLGELTDQPAIQIRFEEASDDEVAGRLAERVDAWAQELAANPKRATSAEVRARWLADAVRDTVVNRPRAGAWSIEILKPSIDGKVWHCPPDRIPQEFSGGQVLTLAVLVYCALSRVRASHRVGGPRPPGALILDNPFGSASAETLIAMQHRLAAHTGLQIVCATGLHDVGVDAAFTGSGSVIVKLRNDGDQRRNLSFLRLRESVVDGVDVPAAITKGRDRSAERNWVDALRYEVRR